METSPVRCEVPKCTRQARYDSPGHWCSVHWNAWWDFGMKAEHRGKRSKPPPKWMTEPKSRRCGSCWGKGKIDGETCVDCNGKGGHYVRV